MPEGVAQFEDREQEKATPPPTHAQVQPVVPINKLDATEKMTSQALVISTVAAAEENGVVEIYSGSDDVETQIIDEIPTKFEDPAPAVTADTFLDPPEPNTAVDRVDSDEVVIIEEHPPPAKRFKTPKAIR